MKKDSFQDSNGSKLFKRIMIKLSGEALLGNKEFGIDSNFVDEIANDISQILSLNTTLRPQNLDHLTYYKICELYEKLMN